jgi:hypothetical protein
MIDYFYYHWGPYLFRTQPKKYIIDRLKVDGKKSKKSYNDSLAGHLKTQLAYSKETQQWFNNEMIPTLSAYRKGHCEYHGLENFEVEYDLIDMWINYMKPGDFNPIHAHGGDLSFVLFLDVPKELDEEIFSFEGTSSEPGCLTFQFANQARPQWATTKIHVVPKTGDLYIFPALLEHTVAPFKSDVIRISVSGNFQIKNRHTFPELYF